MADFLHMGGYAQFVWPSYLLTFLVIALNIWGAVRMHANARERALRRLQMLPVHEAESSSSPSAPLAELSKESA